VFYFLFFLPFYFFCSVIFFRFLFFIFQLCPYPIEESKHPNIE
jgi:hypothetical protein